MDNRQVYSILVSLKAKAPAQFNALLEYLKERRIQTACDGMVPNSDQFTHMVQGAYKELDSLVDLFENCEVLKAYSENEKELQDAANKAFVI